ncbi:MAG: type III secretion system export apparatus subunit SctT [Candidatus Thiodiazotropha sp.]|jgi:type III secretion protein T
MDGFDVINYLSQNALSISLSATRIAIAFYIIPLFTSELIPALVRNSIYLSMAIVTLILQPAVVLNTLSTSEWIILFAKEATIGITIGVMFGIFLWAFETAGQIVDNQIGASVAQVQDPLTGVQTTLIGSFLGRLANYIFITSGGLLLLTGVILQSYVIWPIEKRLPGLPTSGVTVLSGEFFYYLKLTLLIASPMILVILFVDSMMGLINRYAQQFNVFFLSMSLKSLASILILLFTMVSLINRLISELHQHAEQLPAILRSLYGS